MYYSDRIRFVENPEKKNKSALPAKPTWKCPYCQKVYQLRPNGTNSKPVEEHMKACDKPLVSMKVPTTSRVTVRSNSEDWQPRNLRKKVTFDLYRDAESSDDEDEGLAKESVKK